MSKSNSRPLYSLEKAPTFQNKVYESAEAARQAPVGSLNIVWDSTTGCYANADFSEARMQYDTDYDNSVPSQIFLDYYDSIADHLVEQYRLSDSLILDIGCGKGTFITRMIKRHSSLRAQGIDPSYEGDLSTLEGKVRFVCEPFSPKLVSSEERPALVTCRHTLEHVSPVDFIRGIGNAFRAHDMYDIALFVEVPDLDWILDNNAFWDFCYEHVNYFDRSTLRSCLEKGGCHTQSISEAFSSQYLWAEAILNPSTDSKLLADTNPDPSTVERASQMRMNLQLAIERMREIASQRHIVIWGMATKGVMYCIHMMHAGVEVKKCVDINQRKHGRFAPVSAQEICPPEDLDPDNPYAIVCMNPNYMEEIRAQCRDMGLNVAFFDPDGTAL